MKLGVFCLHTQTTEARNFLNALYDYLTKRVDKNVIYHDLEVIAIPFNNTNPGDRFIETAIADAARHDYNSLIFYNNSNDPHFGLISMKYALQHPQNNVICIDGHPATRTAVKDYENISFLAPKSFPALCQEINIIFLDKVLKRIGL